MSSKSSVFLTSQNEHCYDETFEHDGDEFRLYLEIDKSNIKSFSYDEEDGIIIGIKGDSEIAKNIRRSRE